MFNCCCLKLSLDSSFLVKAKSRKYEEFYSWILETICGQLPSELEINFISIQEIDNVLTHHNINNNIENFISSIPEFSKYHYLLFDLCDDYYYRAILEIYIFFKELLMKYPGIKIVVLHKDIRNKSPIMKLARNIMFKRLIIISKHFYFINSKYSKTIDYEPFKEKYEKYLLLVTPNPVESFRSKIIKKIGHYNYDDKKFSCKKFCYSFDNAINDLISYFISVYKKNHYDIILVFDNKPQWAI